MLAWQVRATRNRVELQGRWCGRRDDGPAEIHATLARPEKEIEKHIDAVYHQGLHILIYKICLHNGQQTLEGQSFNLAGLWAASPLGLVAFS